jgi:hypothetical protein
MQLIKININDLKPAVYNPRKKLKSGDPEYEKIKRSILEFGYVDPIIINKDLTVIGGHQRLTVLRDLGYTEIECIIIDIDKTKEKALNIALNKISGQWDIPMLKDLLQELDTGAFDMALTGFDVQELEDLMNQVHLDNSQEDNFNEKKVTTRVNYGEIWSMDKHRILCGDSFSKDQLKQLMNGVKADLGFFDPPYDMENDEWTNNIDIIKNGSPMFLMAGDKQTLKIANKIPYFRHFFIHNRMLAIMISTDTPMSQHTIISFFCEHPGQYFRNIKDHFTTIIEANKNYKDSNEENLSKMGKPIKVPASLIEHYSKKENIILDLFGGGGSVLIACEKLKRICYVNEILPGQCDKIISRWEQYTGKKAEKINKIIYT